MWCGPLRAPVTLSCTTSAASGSRSIRNDRHGNDKAITDNHYQSLLWTLIPVGHWSILLCFDWLEWNNMPGNESPWCHFCYIMSIHNLAQVGTSPTTKPHPLRIWWNEKKASRSTIPHQKENCLTLQKHFTIMATFTSVFFSIWLSLFSYLRKRDFSSHLCQKD